MESLVNENICFIESSKSAKRASSFMLKTHIKPVFVHTLKRPSLYVDKLIIRSPNRFGSNRFVAFLKLNFLWINNTFQHCNIAFRSKYIQIWYKDFCTKPSFFLETISRIINIPISHSSMSSALVNGPNKSQFSIGGNPRRSISRPIQLDESINNLSPMETVISDLLCSPAIIYAIIIGIFLNASND